MRLNSILATTLAKDTKTSVEALDALEWALEFMRKYERKNRVRLQEVRREL